MVVKRIGKHSQYRYFGLLDSNFIEQSFTKFAKLVVKRARYNLTREDHNASGKLYKSLDNFSVSVSSGGSLSLVFDMPEYAQYLDKGVKGAANFKSHKMAEFTPFRYKDKMPPLKDLKQWVKTRGLKFRDKKGRYITQDSTAAIIQRSVYQKGVPQTLFFTKAFRTQFKKLPTDILSSFGDDVDRFLTSQLADKKRFR